MARRDYDIGSPSEEVSRVNAGTPREIDLHGKNVYQARIAIDAALRRAGAEAYRIRVIHGYHGGGALRALVDSYADHPRVRRVERGANEGSAELVLREYR